MVWCGVVWCGDQDVSGVVWCGVVQDINTFLSAAEQLWLQLRRLVFVSVLKRNMLRHTQKTLDAFPFEAVTGRHRLITVDVCGTLWKLDNRQEMADQTILFQGK